MKISVSDCYVVVYYNWSGRISMVDEAFYGPDAKAEAEAEAIKRQADASNLNLGVPTPAFHVVDLDDYISICRNENRD